MVATKEDTEKAKEIAQLIRVHEANCAIKYPNTERTQPRSSVSND